MTTTLFRTKIYLLWWALDTFSKFVNPSYRVLGKSFNSFFWLKKGKKILHWLTKRPRDPTWRDQTVQTDSACSAPGLSSAKADHFAENWVKIIKIETKADHFAENWVKFSKSKQKLVSFQADLIVCTACVTSLSFSIKVMWNSYLVFFFLKS